MLTVKVHAFLEELRQLCQKHDATLWPTDSSELSVSVDGTFHEISGITQFKVQELDT